MSPSHDISTIGRTLRNKAAKRKTRPRRTVNSNNTLHDLLAAVQRAHEQTNFSANYSANSTETVSATNASASLNTATGNGDVTVGSTDYATRLGVDTDPALRQNRGESPPSRDQQLQELYDAIAAVVHRTLSQSQSKQEAQHTHELHHRPRQSHIRTAEDAEGRRRENFPSSSPGSHSVTTEAAAAAAAAITTTTVTIGSDSTSSANPFESSSPSSSSRSSSTDEDGENGESGGNGDKLSRRNEGIASRTPAISCSEYEVGACPLCAVNGEGYTPLIIAALLGDVTLCRMLLGGGTSTRVEPPGRPSNLWHSGGPAAVSTSSDAVPMCDLSLRNRDGNTALHYIVRLHSPVPSAGLLSSPVDEQVRYELLFDDVLERHSRGRGGLQAVSAINRNGETPLHLACARSNLRAVQFLLKHGADSRAKTLSGLTPADYAMQVRAGMPADTQAAALADEIYRIISGTAKLVERSPLRGAAELPSQDADAHAANVNAAGEPSKGGRFGQRLKTGWKKTLRKSRSTAVATVDFVRVEEDESPRKTSSAGISAGSDEVLGQTSSDAGQLNAYPSSESLTKPAPQPRSAEEQQAFLRRQIVQEILLTERGYGADLHFMVDSILAGLKPSVSKSSSRALSRDNIPVCPLKPKDFVSLAVNIESILQAHSQFIDLIALAEETTAEDGGASAVADAFLHFAPVFKIYKEYCGKSESQYATVARLRKKGKFSAYCEKVRQLPKSNRLDLESFLIKPLQRVTRYPLLLRELLKQLPPENEPTSTFQRLTRALGMVNLIVEEVNSRKREVEQQLKLVDLNRTITWSNSLSNGGRLVNSHEEIWDLRSAEAPYYVLPSAKCIYRALAAIRSGAWGPSDSRRRWATAFSQRQTVERPHKQRAETLLSEESNDHVSAASALGFAAAGRELHLELDVHFGALEDDESHHAQTWTPSPRSTFKAHRRVMVFGDVLVLCKQNKCVDVFSFADPAVAAKFTIFQEDAMVRISAPVLHCTQDVRALADFMVSPSAIDVGSLCTSRIVVLVGKDSEFDQFVSSIRGSARFVEDGIVEQPDFVELLSTIRPTAPTVTATPQSHPPLPPPCNTNQNLISFADENDDHLLSDNGTNGQSITSSVVHPRAPPSSSHDLRSERLTVVVDHSSHLSSAALDSKRSGFPSFSTDPHKQEDLDSASWYFGAISRDEATLILQQQDAFTTRALPHRFLVRKSSQEGAYVLSVWDGIRHEAQHVLIVRASATPIGWVVSGDKAASPYIAQTIVELVTSHPTLRELRLTEEAGVVRR